MVIHTHKLANNKGLTLIELMVVIVIIGILAGIGYPLYETQSRKGKRSDAITALAIARNDMERCYYNEGNDSYFMAAGPCQPTINTSQYGYYTIQAQVQPQAYTITATPVGPQLQDDCVNFMIDNQGNKTVSGVGNFPDAATAIAQCWRN